MFKHILVPLDGSKLAEAALPPACLLAEKLGTAVTLFHVIESKSPGGIHGEHHLTRSDEAQRYLETTARQAFPAGVKVECHVHTSEARNVALSIVEHTSELAPDLIVMCAHGEGGLRDLMVGSIAQQVVSQCRIPVLLIQPKAGMDTTAAGFEKLAVALDGNPQHETCLEVGGELALNLGAGLHLVMVVHTPGTLKGKRAATGKLLPAATSAMLEIHEEAAVEYLTAKAVTWQKKGLAVTAEVRRGDPATRIVEACERVNASLLVLGTHGKAGMGAFWAGSVAPRVTALTHLPLLFVPAHRREV
jgi:nucleotide-binding universal stress UspA family protein